MGAGYAKHEVGLLAATESGKPRARSMILGVFEKSRCHMGETAKAFGCNHSTLTRWVSWIPGLAEELERVRARALREGWHHDRGRQATGRPPGGAEKRRCHACGRPTAVNAEGRLVPHGARDERCPASGEPAQVPPTPARRRRRRAAA